MITYNIHMNMYIQYYLHLSTYYLHYLVPVSTAEHFGNAFNFECSRKALNREAQKGNVKRHSVSQHCTHSC